MQLIESILADAAGHRRHPARHPRPPRALLRGAAHLRRHRQGAHRLGHPGRTAASARPAWSASSRTAAVGARRRPARRHRRAADDRAQHASRMPAGTPARCTPAATTATPRCCWRRPSTWRKHRNFDGTVYLVFQPAEEGGGGAREMIKDGLFERFPMEAIFGAHNWPGLAVGQFARQERARASRRATNSRSRSAARAAHARDAAPRHRPGAGGLPDGAGLPDHHHAQQAARSTPA